LLVGGALIAFQYVLGGAAAPLREGKFAAYELFLGLPLCFAWLTIEVGLVEEFFFRALVQSQLAAWFKSEVGGVVLMSLIFGLAHARVHFSSSGKRGRSGSKSKCARCARLLDRGARGERDSLWRDLVPNKESVRAHVAPRSRRSCRGNQNKAAPDEQD